jgi:hypothetical protein
MPETRFPGRLVVLGGRPYILPPIALGKLREMQPRLEKLDVASGGMPTGDDLDTIIDMTHAALRRNYPDIAREEIEEVLDMGNLKEIVSVVMGQSGLEPAGKPVLEGTPSP